MKYVLITSLSGERRIAADENNRHGNGVEFTPSEPLKYYAWDDGGQIYLDAERKARYEREDEIKTLTKRLEALSRDIVQSMAGEDVPELGERKAEFRAAHNRVRELQGKEKRKIQEDF
jgi:hypothetical protein